MESGRNEGPPHGFITVEWMAYQGAPPGGASGEVSIWEWWSSTKCETVDISSNGFQSTPTVLVTAKHELRDKKHDAASIWLEDATFLSFRVCLRELQNFDGAHRRIHVNWLAFEVLERPLFIEHGSADFSRMSSLPWNSVHSNYAQCKHVSISVSTVTSLPTVLVSPKHNSTGNLDPQYNGITAWIESIYPSGFKMCFKELFYVDKGYDPVTVSFVVLRDICEPGWMYYRGLCYERVTSCETWTSASSTCMANSSKLVRIESAEEDVFVQHLHRGRASWIGLNDQANEGVYLWTDGGPVTYTHWGPGISSPPTNDQADCVDSSGRENDYVWQTLSCDNCQNFTCKKDYDECNDRDGINECDSNADCVNTIGSYTCQCRAGYTGDGKTCTDVNECSLSTFQCDINANCVNTVGSYACRCPLGDNTCTIYCGDPGSPSRGYASGSSFTQGSTVTFNCSHSGEVLTGESSTTCQANNTWSNITPPRCEAYGIRLRGSAYGNRGRVEIYNPLYGWGTVCDDDWDLNDAQVVCRQLGYSGAQNAQHRAAYGQGTGTILLDDLQCTGSESYLWECTNIGWANHNCVHAEDASVDCY